MFVIFVPDDPEGTVFVQQLGAGKAAAKTPAANTPVSPQAKTSVANTPAPLTAKPPPKSAPKPAPKPARRKLTADEYAALLLEGKDPAEFGDPIRGHGKPVGTVRVIVGGGA